MPPIRFREGLAFPRDVPRANILWDGKAWVLPDLKSGGLCEPSIKNILKLEEFSGKTRAILPAGCVRAWKFLSH